MNRLIHLLSLGFLMVTAAWAQEKPVSEPPQLTKQRADYLRARQRDASAVVAKYLRALEALKQQFARESKLEAGAAVEREIRKVTEANQLKAPAVAPPRGRRVVVQAYIEENFKGREYRIEGPAEYTTAAAAGIPNDKLASMKIPPGIVVTLFGNAGYKGNSEKYTGDVPTVGPMMGRTTSLTITVGEGAAAPAIAGVDSPELTARRADYEAELKRAITPAMAAYRRNLQALKDQLTRESKFEAALSVEGEIRKVAEE